MPTPAPPPRPLSAAEIETTLRRLQGQMKDLENEQLAERLVLQRERDAQAKIIAEAVTQGLRAAVADPEFWAAGSAAMQRMAREQAGGWLLGSLRALLSRVALLVAIGMGVYALGGWTALVALFKAAAGHGPPAP